MTKKPGQQEHASHKDDPPWRGHLIRAVPGGGWESVEVLVPAAALGSIATDQPHQKNELGVVLGRIEAWYASISLRVRR